MASKLLHTFFGMSLGLAAACASSRGGPAVPLANPTEREADEVSPEDLPESRTLRQEQEEAVKECYERALAAHPDLTGQIVMGWRVSPDGTVPLVWVKERKIKGSVAKCVKAAIRQWTFEPPESGDEEEMEYPFEFTPE